MAAVERIKSLLTDLGKPTQRGVRKCPHCGTLNGTRGSSCKNKLCGFAFKEKAKKKSHSADGVKLRSSSSMELFSIRMRDRGPDYRTFVQLPHFLDLIGSHYLIETGKCYADSCPGLKDDGNEQCIHVRVALATVEIASILELDDNVAESLIPREMLALINRLNNERPGPLVQRVSTNVMVVKCDVTDKHPTGFLHAAFTATSRKRTELEHKFQCSCTEYRNAKDFGSIREESMRRCVHFYACVSAFASNEKLAEEFSFFISRVKQMNDESLMVGVEEIAAEDSTILLPCEDVVSQVVEGDIELIIEGGNIKRADGLMFDYDQLVSLGCSDENGPLSNLDNCNVVCDFNAASNDNLVEAASIAAVENKMAVVQTPVKQCAPKKNSILPQLDECQVFISFEDWLSYVTDRINQTMHYQFDGNPKPLVFHIPQKFFDCLERRISAGSGKRRLPNSAESIVRVDSPPLGTFTKYTWKIGSILHVKQIFDNSKRNLQLTRYFVENSDGTFDLFESSKESQSTGEDFGKQPIRPFELKTFLKVGFSLAEQPDLTPFIIEWIPDIQKRTHFGELRLKFQYGHQRNGQLDAIARNNTYT